MNATRTYARHVTAADNLRQRHYARLSDAAQAKREAWRRERVELTPTYTVEKPVARETAEEN